MSYTNNAGQTVNVGDRVAYAGYTGHLYIGKVVGFTLIGSPRIEIEGKFVDMVRNRWRHKEVYQKYSGAPIWDRRPRCHWLHKTAGYLITSDAWRKLPYDERSDYEQDAGQLGSEWIEFQIPYVFAIVKRSHVLVIEPAS